MSMQVLPTAPSPTVTHLMNLAVLIVLPPPSFPGLLELLLLVVVDVCLCLPGLGWSGGYGQMMQGY
jgi:hypothetical protein